MPDKFWIDNMCVHLLARQGRIKNLFMGGGGRGEENKIYGFSLIISWYVVCNFAIFTHAWTRGGGWLYPVAPPVCAPAVVFRMMINGPAASVLVLQFFSLEGAVHEIFKYTSLDF